MKAPVKQVDNEATGLHTSVLGNQVELKAFDLAEVALQNMDTDVVSVPETPVEVEASGVHARMSSAQAGVQIPKKEVEVPEKQANGEAFEIPNPRVRRIIAFPEIPAKTLETDMKFSELPSKARELHVEVTGKIIGVEGIQAQGKVAERVGSQGSADSDEGDEGDGESEDEDLDTGTEDESSESLGHETDADDEEDAGDPSNSLGEVPLRDEDLQELVDHLLKVESEAADAQEMLEEESLASLRNEVKAELGEKLSGLELDSAVEEEVNTYYEQWEERYEDLQEQSSTLQEKLEDAGVNLPHLFKGIEKQAPEGCRTEAWKQRTHWAGHQPTEEVEVVVKRAEEELKIRHPVRSQRGKLVEEGASGFLGRKLVGEVEDGGESSTSKYELADDSGWSKVNDFLHDDEIPQPGSLMGTKRWAAVYLASTPEQAVQLGLAFPGADTVDEIGDVGSERQFKAAFANEKERGLTDQQRKSIKKVRDEDDVKRSRNVRKKEWKRLSNRLHVKTLLKATGAHLAVVGDIVQPKKSLERSLVVSSNGEPEDGINKLTTGSGSDGMHLGSDNKGTQGVASRHRSGHVKEVDENLALVIYKKGPFENCMGTGSIAIEPEVDFLRHDVALHAVPLGHDALVELEENNLSENREVMDSNRTDRPDWLEEMPPVHGVVPGFELRKKHARDDECQQDNSDEEFSLKRCKRISIKDEVGISREGQKEMACGNSDSLKQDPQQPSSPSKPMLYRTTVVIDSDGEREVEEAIGESLQFYSTPSQLTGNTKHLLNSSGYAGQQVSKSEPIADAKKRKYKPSPSKEKREFPCTACGEYLKKKDVLRHPKLPVGICKHCRKHYLSGPFRKDEDGSDSECSWCGEGGKVICCDSCDKVFCQACISRNFGSAEALRVVTSDDWLCYFCNPVPLSIFTRLLAQAELESGLAKGERTEPGAIVQDAIANIGEDASRQSKKGRHRKNIRKVLDDDELEEKQKELLAREKERQERLEQWRAAAGNTIASNPRRRKSTLADLPETTGEDRDVINVARAENEAPVKIAASLAAVLKEHQLKGVRFMWENCIVSEKKVREGGESFGCILAHSMGLGKTLQVITFIHTVLNRNLGLTTALIVVPVNVLHNWKKEFDIWQAEVSHRVFVFMLDDSNRENSRRATLLSQWKEDGGVMLVGYSAFRNLSLGKHVKDKATRDELCQALQNPGPDLLVCDEAHMIKNNKADITQVLKQVKTRRRIALTGSPLQNNLMEYYCMVDFVREGFMGTPHVFKNRFQNPIENGQHADSTEDDVKVMKRRTYVLHKQLKGFVQRMNMSVLKDELPPKCVYVISVRLSALQRKLYSHYLQVHGLLQEDDEAMENRSQRKWLFHAYHAFAKVWNHPDLLLLAEEEEDKKQKDNVEDLVADSEEEKFDDDGKAKMSMGVRQLKKKGSAELEQLEKPLWWKGAFPEDYTRENVEVSGKMVLLLRLLSNCSFKGDKALVFSQSLGTLTMIERFLEKIPLVATKGTWERDKNWYRLDGSTPSLARLQMCERFNDPSNTSAKCVLISTRAGSLGINLPAANRVIIVDGSWNPTHDLQALFRAWRLGQKKPVYAYRLLAHGTMEEKIYSRQVAKEGVAARVLDEQQVGSHFAKDDLEGLFRLEDDGDKFVAEDGKSLVPVGAPNIGTSSGALFSPFSVGSRSKSKLLDFTVPVDAPPRDDLMGNMLIDYRPRWVVSYHEHEPLLEHREEENLTSEEQKAAWESYRLEGLNGAQIIQNVITTETRITSTYTNTVVTKATAGTSSVRCTAKDHAHFMTDRKLNVGQEIICPTCLLLISWENLIGQEQGFGHSGG